MPGVEFATIGCGSTGSRAAIAGQPNIVLSHDNSPNQTIVCGPPDEIAELVAEFRKAAVISQVLPFRSGFHTPMLKPFLEPFVDLADRLDMVRPTLPIWSATTASPYPTDPDGIRDLYIRHLIEPVRFRATVRAMHDAGIRVFIQVGAGQLGSLIDDTLKGTDHLTVAANSPHRGGVDQLRLVAAALWVEGASPDFSAVEPTRQPVTLQLGSPLVTVDTTISTGPSRLDSLSAEFPIAAELEALLRETAESAAQVLAVRRGPSIRSLTKRVTVSTEAMPFLLDHCFAPQRQGWPDLADRRPVVPGTTLIQLMMDAAEQAAPGLRAVRVHDVKLLRWLIGAPATDVTITVEPVGADRVRVAVGDHSQAVVELAPIWAPRPRSAWSVAAGERMTPDMTAREFYERRVMFHGPTLQGITALTSVGANHVSGVITTPDVPGGLLDNVGQLLGYWIWVTQTEKRIAFPVQMGRIEFFGPHPPPGTPVDCLIKVVDVSDRLYQVDAQLTVNGVVWAEIADWRDRRFDSHMDLDEAWRFPERNALSQRQPGGWVAVAERWPDLASRELYLSKYLSGRERACYDRLPPRSRRHWLLGRIAVKDAVRQLLWDNGSGPVFPAEILVADAADGQVTVAGHHGFPLPAVSVGLAHKDELGVSIARFGRVPVSIAIEDPAAAAVGDGRQRAAVSNPTDLPPRQYVVAWTAGPADQEDE